MRLRSRDPRPRATEPRRPPMMANRCPNRRTRSAATMQHTTEIFEASSIPAGNVEKSRHGHGARHACKRHRVNHAPFIFQAPRQVMSYGQRPKFRTPDPNVFPPRPIFSRSSITAPRRWGRCCRILGARTHARTHALTHALTHARAHARAHARTHALTHARTHARTRSRAHALTRSRTLSFDRAIGPRTQSQARDDIGDGDRGARSRYRIQDFDADTGVASENCGRVCTGSP